MPDFRAGERTFQLFDPSRWPRRSGRYGWRGICPKFNPFSPSIEFGGAITISRDFGSRKSSSERCEYTSFVHLFIFMSLRTQRLPAFTRKVIDGLVKDRPARPGSGRAGAYRTIQRIYRSRFSFGEGDSPSSGTLGSVIDKLTFWKESTFRLTWILTRFGSHVPGSFVVVCARSRRWCSVCSIVDREMNRSITRPSTSRSRSLRKNYRQARLFHTACWCVSPNVCRPVASGFRFGQT